MIGILALESILTAKTGASTSIILPRSSTSSDGDFRGLLGGEI